MDPILRHSTMSVLIMMMRPSLLTLLAVAATMTLLSLDNTVHAFVPNGGMQSTQRCQPFFLAATLPTPEESAKALQNYMARSHEEKIKAIAAVEEKYRNQILELEKQVASLEGNAPVQNTATSFVMPATNKAMTEKVEAYQNFLSAYIIKAQEEKAKAVATAEAKLKEKYEAIIAEMKES